MSKCRKHIKCNRIKGKIIGTDISGNYIALAKNKTYTLYDEDINIKKDRTLELYELPDGVLLSKLTPSLGLTYENSVSKRDYESTLDDTFTDKILKRSFQVGGHVSIAVAIFEIFLLLITGNVSMPFAVLVIISLILVCLGVSAYYNYYMQKKYSNMTPQEYFEETGELAQEEIYQICEHRLKNMIIKEEKHGNNR